MGYATALDLANSNETLPNQIYYHLRVNHYPPVPIEMVTPCVEAIEACWELDNTRPIQLPEDTFYKGKTEAPAWAIVQGHHLEAWLEEEEEEF